MLESSEVVSDSLDRVTTELAKISNTLTRISRQLEAVYIHTSP